MQNSSGQRDARLDVVCPAQGRYLWDIFNGLGRSGGRISQQEYAAWQGNYRTRLTGWEIDTLRAIDQVAAQVGARNQQVKQ